MWADPYFAMAAGQVLYTTESLFLSLATKIAFTTRLRATTTTTTATHSYTTYLCSNKREPHGFARENVAPGRFFGRHGSFLPPTFFVLLRDAT